MQSTAFRACETCRALKVRCEPAAGDAGGSAAAAGGNAPSAALPPVSERPPCRRCRDTGAACVYTEPRRTKRKRTDVRVRELEREVRMLSDLLLLRRRVIEEGLPAGADSPSFLYARSPPAAAAAAVSPAQWSLPGTPSALLPDTPSALLPPSATVRPELTLDPQLPPAPALTAPSPPQPETADAVAAGLLSMDKAVGLFRRYVTIMAPQRPFVVFPTVTLSMEEDMTPEVDSAIPRVAALVREQRPVLFLSILAAAAGTGTGVGEDALTNNGYGEQGHENHALGTVLDALLLRIYADRIMHEGQKSLELVQALLISANWNFYYFEKPPNGARPGNSNGDVQTSGFDKLRFYQHLHMAATMAIELESMQRGGDGNFGSSDGPLADPVAFERTLLACYMCCSSISLGFHAHTMFNFTPLMAEYLKRLETSRHAASTDAVMVAWVHLQWIVDMTAGTLGLRALVDRIGGSKTSLDNASEKVPDLSDPSIQLSLQNVTQRLEQWRLDHRRCMTNSLLIQYHTVMCLLHESCFYNEFDPADMKPPYRITIPARTPSDAAASTSLTPAHLVSRRTCLMAARSLIGLFLASPTEQLLGSPVVVYARIGYAIVVLLKLQISAALPGGAMNGLLIDSVTGDSATQVYHYIESLIVRLEELDARGGRIAAVWLSILRAIHEWYEAYFVPAASGGGRTDSGIASASGSDTDIDPVLRPMHHCLFSNCKPNRAEPLVAPTRSRGPRPPITDEGYRELVANFGTNMCGILSSVSREEEEEILSTALTTGELDQWMDSRVELGDIQSQLFEFSGLQLPS